MSFWSPDPDEEKMFDIFMIVMIVIVLAKLVEIGVSFIH